jgi:hypothetical protein
LTPLVQGIASVSSIGKAIVEDALVFESSVNSTKLGGNRSCVKSSQDFPLHNLHLDLVFVTYPIAPNIRPNKPSPIDVSNCTQDPSIRFAVANSSKNIRLRSHSAHAVFWPRVPPPHPVWAKKIVCVPLRSPRFTLPVFKPMTSRPVKWRLRPSNRWFCGRRTIKFQ